MTRGTRQVYARPVKVGKRVKKYLGAEIPAKFLRAIGAKAGDRLRFDVQDGRVVVDREEAAGA